MDDGLLTGYYCDAYADLHAKVNVSETPNLFKNEHLPVRGDSVRIIWSTTTTDDVGPSVTYENDIPKGVCLLVPPAK